MLWFDLFFDILYILVRFALLIHKISLYLKKPSEIVLQVFEPPRESADVVLLEFS